MAAAKRRPRGLPGPEHTDGTIEDLPTRGTGIFHFADREPQIKEAHPELGDLEASGVADDDPAPVVTPLGPDPEPFEDPTPMAPGPIHSHGMP